MRRLLIPLIAVAAASSACSSTQFREVNGTGVGSECDFSGQFAEMFPCEHWEGDNLATSDLSDVFWHLKNEGTFIGLASTKPIQAIEGDIVVAAQVDGTFAMMLIAFGHGGSTFTVIATDGSESKCGINRPGKEFFECDNW